MRKKSKVQLLKCAKSIYPAPKHKKLETADSSANGEFKIGVIFLSVGHSELNPRELICSSLKGYAAARNQYFRLTVAEKKL